MTEKQELENLQALEGLKKKLDNMPYSYLHPKPEFKEMTLNEICELGKVDLKNLDINSLRQRIFIDGPITSMMQVSVVNQDTDYKGKKWGRSHYEFAFDVVDTNRPLVISTEGNVWGDDIPELIKHVGEYYKTQDYDCHKMIGCGIVVSSDLDCYWVDEYDDDCEISGGHYENLKYLDIPELYNGINNFLKKD